MGHMKMQQDTVLDWDFPIFTEVILEETKNILSVQLIPNILKLVKIIQHQRLQL